MTRINSPIESAYHTAVSGRLYSVVYFALNNGVPPKERQAFKKDWRGRGFGLLVELLLQCASPNWNSYPETFWVDPWIAEHLPRGGDHLYYFVEKWVNDEPLPALISPDPCVEHQKVMELEHLYLALNR